MRAQVRVAVVAPAPALRAGLSSLLSASADVEVAAEAAALGDLRLPLDEVDVLVVAAESAWREELEEALTQPGSAAVLLLVGNDEAALRWLAARAQPLGARAWGALSLESSADELLAAARALSQGLVAAAPALLQPLLTRQLASGDEPGDLPAGALTERETEVLQLLAQGLANKQIALQLGISEHTVKFHVSAVYGKLGASNRTEAVRLGVRQGWVTL